MTNKPTEALETKLNEPEEIYLRNSLSEFTQLDDLVHSNPADSGRGPHHISTIDELNERIANLSTHFDEFYGHEEIYSFSDEEEEESKSKYNSIQNNKSKGTEKERKDLKQFSGVYSLQTILSKEDKSKPKVTFKKDTSNVSKKPLLVELHSFPGYDDIELTPLPALLTAEFMLQVVVDAQKYLKNKATFKKSFYKFFTQPSSVTVFQDTFWWFFCHKYQHSEVCQEKLFDRIAKNYTKLLFSKSQEQNHDKYFKNYGDLLSQAVYATFCHAFPASYRQFNGEFRDEIISICALWIIGTKPPPRTWEDWNFEALEPLGMRKGERIQEDAAKTKAIDFDLKQMEEKSRLMTRRNTRRLSRAIMGGSSGTIPLKTLIEATKEKDVANKEAKEDNKKSKKKKLKDKKESSEEESHVKQISSVLAMAESNKHKQSCEVGPGASFNKVVFNMNGRSPLVSYYLSSNNLLQDVGTSVLVQRTEIDKLPPYPFH
ncbi:protein FAM227A-like [Clytia hemisphaerica]|uniref:Uncharacterized protein n=1 Tax=Clytia hemisphaerica TaxID=252671 RepID=A0A7M5X7Y5_9CNID